jgi:hypothetical protein
LSIRYFSKTSRIAMISPESASTRATSSSRWMVSARSAVQDRVIGIGQNRPLASLMSRQAPRQSSSPMKPSSGV